LKNDRTASGYRRSDGWGGNKVYYFVMEFSRPFDSAGVAQADKDVTGKQTTGKETKGHFDFKTKAGEQILVRVGLSTVSVEGARKNLHAEIPGWDFDAVVMAARKQWEKALNVFDRGNPGPQPPADVLHLALSFADRPHAVE
jgi:putative alpha-1,2-mannosidase